jgi:hypothetical protein
MKKPTFSQIFVAVIVLSAAANAGYTGTQLGATSVFHWAFLYACEAVSLLIVFSNIRIYAEARSWFWLSVSLSILSRIGIGAVIYFQFKGATDNYAFWQHEVFSFIIAAAELLASILSSSKEVALREQLEIRISENRIAETQNSELRNRISILEGRLENEQAHYAVAETHLRNAAAMLGISLKELRTRARTLALESGQETPQKMAESAEKNGESQAKSIVIQNITQVSASAFAETQTVKIESENAVPQNEEIESENAELRNAEIESAIPQMKIAGIGNVNTELRNAEIESANKETQNAELQWLPNPRHGMQAFQARESYQQTVKRSTVTTEETITSVSYSQIKMALTDAHIKVLRAAGFSKALPGAVLTNKQIRDFATACKGRGNLAAHKEIMDICKDKTLWLLPG